MPPQDLEKRVRLLENVIAQLCKSDRYVIHKDMRFLDGRKILIGTDTGLQIGTTGGASGAKIGFFGVTPVVQQSQDNANDVGGSYSQSEVQDIADTVNGIISDLKNLGLYSS